MKPTLMLKLPNGSIQALIINQGERYYILEPSAPVEAAEQIPNVDWSGDVIFYRDNYDRVMQLMQSNGMQIEPIPDSITVESARRI